MKKAAGKHYSKKFGFGSSLANDLVSQRISERLA
jgi:hypothetical protein